MWPVGQWWYLHDNDPKHESNIIKAFIFNNGIHRIEFPPYSPDLNPIENVWNMLKQNVDNHTFQHTSGPAAVKEYMNCFVEEWKHFDVAMLRKLVDDMPERCKEVIANKGHKIKR